MVPKGPLFCSKTLRDARHALCTTRSGLEKKISLARAFLECLGRGGELPAANNSKTIHDIEIKFGRVVENHKLIKLV